MRKCKVCGKELIGKEKFFCNSCWSKGKDKAKKGGIFAFGLVGFALLAFTQKDKIADAFKDDSDI
jgi:hypothetical protein